MVDHVSVEIMECHVTRISHDILTRNEEGEKGKEEVGMNRYIYEGMGIEGGCKEKGEMREEGEKTSRVLLQIFGK